jgi:hypothetical protein
VLARGMLVDQSRLPKGTWKQQPNCPAERKRPTNAVAYGGRAWPSDSCRSVV